jgi:predicted RNA binding protein YcfA (HicA-like mRNA interferase family)
LKLPRDLNGLALARLLNRYGYAVTRQTGNHLRLTSSYKSAEDHITIPAHAELRIGTLAAMPADVAGYLEIDRAELAKLLFES